MTAGLVGIGQDCVIVLDPKVMTPDGAEALAAALIRGARLARQPESPPARETT